jgi:preprotein translocase subunit SecA
MIQRTMLMLLAAALVTGCSDQRLVELANENAARQSEQNREMDTLNQSTADGTKHLVEADAQARSELLKAEEPLTQQRSEIDAERKPLAHERRADSIIVNAVSSAAILVACILPLAVAISRRLGLAGRITCGNLRHGSAIRGLRVS